MTKPFEIISHRGNLYGPNRTNENTPTYIDEAIKAGYTVEVDIHYVRGNFYLGHNNPDTCVTLYWLKTRKENLILHCKSLNALLLLKDEYHCFSHENDDRVLTSKGLIWTYPGKKVGPDCVIVDVDPPTKEKINTWKKDLFYGVCTDYPYEVFDLA